MTAGGNLQERKTSSPRRGRGTRGSQKGQRITKKFSRGNNSMTSMTKEASVNLNRGQRGKILSSGGEGVGGYSSPSQFSINMGKGSSRKERLNLLRIDVSDHRGGKKKPTERIHLANVRGEGQKKDKVDSHKQPQHRLRVVEC